MIAKKLSSESKASATEVPSIKLFTIGDSISQGFMSMAAARTDLSYSSIVAREMDWISDHPFWDKGGHPLNLELFFRKLTKRIGHEWDTWNPFELIKLVDGAMDILDSVEDFYERGEGIYDSDYVPVKNGNDILHQDFFHNVAVRGFNVADAWTVSADLAKRMIDKDKDSFIDNRLGGPSASFFRTAARVLSRLPQTKPQYNTYTAIDWLEHHTKHNGGVENVFLWLGSNNALATVLDMKISQSPGNLPPLPRVSTALNDKERSHLYALYENYYNKYNLWHINDFLNDYQLLLDYVDKALINSPVDTKVFLGTIPYVTIAPIARGMGKEFEINGRRYFEYYTYFPFDDERLADHPKLPVLRLSEVLFIEETIAGYNRVIKELVAARNKDLKKSRYYIVDIATSFEQMAFRRNHGVPAYTFPDYINNRYPKPDTRFYERHQNQGSKGGLFSLDGVHPTAIGQGLLAYEFMCAMLGAGIKMETVQQKIIKNNVESFVAVPKINWERIYNDDLLYSHPLPLAMEIFKHDRLKKFVIESAHYFKR
ncbi:hypothetical protein [Olivibacter jilunii]|uniref:hypothetical protein n=1 Tax=Olivibacter jilunii TaxID=985016 RepID=UPI00102FCB79|nr:hypothetical protein [Olivibacter jilunii]